MPLDLPGTHSHPNLPQMAVERFADNGTVYLVDESRAYLTFHDGVFAALFAFVPDRSDLFRGINMNANGIINAKPWDPLTGSPGSDDKSRYLKTGPGHPHEEYLGPPNRYVDESEREVAGLALANPRDRRLPSRGAITGSPFRRRWARPSFG